MKKNHRPLEIYNLKKRNHVGSVHTRSKSSLKRKKYGRYLSEFYQDGDKREGNMRKRNSIKRNKRINNNQLIMEKI